MSIGRHIAPVVLLLLIGCATANRPDSEFDFPEGPRLEAPFVSASLGEEDLEHFKSTAVTKYRDLLDLSSIVADTSFAPTFRDAALESLASYFRLSGEEPSMLAGLSYRLAELADEQEKISDFTKSGSNYRATISASDDLQLEVLLMQVQKSFGQEIHLVWDVMFLAPE